MGIKEEIKDYINKEEFTGVLLLTGKWGEGKTFLVNDLNVSEIIISEAKKRCNIGGKGCHIILSLGQR